MFLIPGSFQKILSHFPSSVLHFNQFTSVRSAGGEGTPTPTIINRSYLNITKYENYVLL